MGDASPSYRFLVNPPWADVPRASAVVGTPLAGDYHTGSYRTTLSLKSVPRGVATFATPRTRYRLDPSSIVVLNHGQTYTLDIDARDRAATLSLFFEPGLVEDVAQAMGARPSTWLEGPADAPRAIEVCERAYPKTGRLAQRLDSLARTLQRGAPSPADVGDAMLDVAAEIVHLDGRARREMEALPGLRAATRAEAYRRLHWAKDFLDASFAEPLTVARLAKVACMSPFHFQRLFKQAFGETPMRRVQQLRLAKAAELLATTDREVTRVCLDVGFESLGTFSALFRRRFGVPPSAVRRA